MRKGAVKYVYDGEIQIYPVSSETEILSYANGTTVNLEILRNGSGKPLIIIPSEFVPYANFTYAPLNPIVNQNITFDATSSWTFDPNAAIISYEWCFGDGTNGTGMIVNHTYPLPGNYIVSLEVTDSVGRRWNWKG
jgi:PKD repeat protein